MEKSKRSRTVEIPAIMRALHQTLDDDPKILADLVAPRLVNAGDREWVEALLDHPFAKQWRAGFALRARYAEDILAERIGGGLRQYVILGAGLDTFAYRQPPWARPLRIYEVDDPLTQQWKRERLQAAEIPTPSNLRFVPIDFERSSLQDALAAADFGFDEKTFCSLMGVIQYLTPAALDATFQFVLALPPASEIVFSFILPQEAVSGVEGEALAMAAQRATEFGEPWLTRLTPDQLAVKLRSLGFSRTIHLTPEEARRRYFEKRSDGLRERYGEQLMRAMV